jgi:hypothetical protein
VKKLVKAAAFAAGTVIAMGVATPAFASSDAFGAAAHSPGLLSGNVIEVPVQVPVEVCGDTIDVIGLLDPAFGSTCVEAD